MAQVQKSYIKCPNSKHPHMIDLGLPSGTMWACCNLGALSPEQYGAYYAWGETKKKSTFYWKNYKHYNSSSDYSVCIDTYDIAGTKYDAAVATWGKSWQMPTHEQCEELVKNTTMQHTIQKGIKGCKLTGRNGGVIFLPFAGSRIKGRLGNAGYEGSYWSSTLEDGGTYNGEPLPDGIEGISIGRGSIRVCTWSNMYKEYFIGYCGFSIRPVSNE